MRQETRSTCCYCGVGCGVIIETERDQIVAVRGDEQHPANRGRLCTKGSTLHLTAHAGGRLLQPMMRGSRQEARQPVDWDLALDTVAARIAACVAEHGPDSIGLYLSGQLLTEDYYVFNKLAKGLLGTNNVDTNSRLCMSSAVAGYKATLGMDSVPTCYDDIAHTDCLLIAGSNTAFAHPIVFRRIEDARRANPDLKLIVIDPRRTDTAAMADLHLPILPGTDVALFLGMLHVLLWEGLVDGRYIRDHTSGFDALKETVREYTPAMVAQLCGVSEADLVQAAKWFGQARAALSMYCQGLNQSAHGTDKNAALINLHLATGQIGRPGAGPFSLTGQPNAMGGREVGGLANLLSAHRDLGNPAHRAEVAALWGVPAVPARPGKAAVEMFEAARQGEIKILWIVCTNPAQSMPNVNLVREAMERAELVIVQEAYAQTDTTMLADILLPAATWGEKEGTVTNSERRITHVRSAVPAAGAARPDWQIAVAVAQRLEAQLRPGQATLFPYADAESVFNEHRATTRGRDLDMTGLSYALLDAHGPQQWPFPEGAVTGQARLYEDGVFPTPDGKARFANLRYQPPAEAADARFPLRLTTGRLRDQWHGMSRTGLVARLYQHVEEPWVSLHPSELTRRKLSDGAIVRVRSRRGELVLRVQADADVRPGQAFIPMHWGGQFMRGAGVNALTSDAVDPVSRQPELKHCAVQVEALPCGWQMVLMRRGDALQRLRAVQPLLDAFTYAAVGLFGRDEPALIVRLACEQPPDAALIATLDRVCGMEQDEATLDYADPRRNVFKRVRVEQGSVAGVRLAGETAARDWLKELMDQGVPADKLRPWLLAPVATPPEGHQGRGRIVCNCMDVSERDIQSALAQGATLDQLQSRLKCGTQCGSCVPELKRMLVMQVPQPA